MLTAWPSPSATTGRCWTSEARVRNRLVTPLLGRVKLLRGENARATGLLLESLAIRHWLEDRGGVAQCLEGLVAVAVAGRPSWRAARLFGAAAGLRRTIDSHLAPAEQVGYERDLAMGGAQIDEDSFAEAFAVAQAMTPDAAVAYAREETDDDRDPRAGVERDPGGAG